MEGKGPGPLGVKKGVIGAIVIKLGREIQLTVLSKLEGD